MEQPVSDRGVPDVVQVDGGEAAEHARDELAHQRHARGAAGQHHFIQFRGADGGSVGDGFAGKFKSFTDKLLASDGFFATKAKIYEQSLKLNAKDVETINDRADRLEKSLTARFSALDTKMSSLNALNAYISQQVTAWNKSSG